MIDKRRANIPHSGYWFKCREVSEELWVGPTPSADADFVEVGVTLVVGVDHLQCRQAAGRADEGWSARRSHGEGKVLYLHMPFELGEIPEPSILATAVTAIRSQLDAGGRVLIYDFRQTERAALIAGAVMVASDVNGFEAAKRLSEAGVLTTAAYLEWLVDQGTSA